MDERAARPQRDRGIALKPLGRDLLGILVMVAVSLGFARFVRGSLLAYLAAGVAAAIPQKRGWDVRAALGVIAGLLTFFVVRAWPGALEELDAAREPATLLSWLIGAPIAGAIGVLALPRDRPKFLQGFTIAVMLGTFALALPLLTVRMGRGFHFDQNIPWVPSLGIRYHVALDGISLWLVLLTVFIQPVAAWVSFGARAERLKDWCFALLLLEGTLIGAFVSLDLVLFYVFWELMLVPIFLMIGVWGGAHRIRSALKLFLFTMTGSVAMLVAIVYLAHTYARVSPDKVPSYDYFELARLDIPAPVQTWLFAAFALSFLVKVPMWPLHTWQADAYENAPTGGSMILAAVMSKVGAYGYLRFCMGLFPEVAASMGATLSGIAVLGGILYGALAAWKQRDVKRLLAYASLSHMGYVMLGLFAATPSSLEGAILAMVSHGVVIAALFLLVGVLQDHRPTRLVDGFGGLAKSMPVTAALFFIAALASAGVPGTSGFVGELMVITGTFVSGRLGHLAGLHALGAAIGVVVGAVYMFGVFQKIFLGPVARPATAPVVKNENASVTDIDGRALVAVTPLILMVFIVGLFPNIFLSRMNDAALRVHEEYASRLAAKVAPRAEPMGMRARSPDAPPVLNDPRSFP